MNIRRGFFALLIGIYFAGAAFGQDQVFLKVQKDAFEPILISVPFFSPDNNSELATELREIIVTDLAHSGFFRVVETLDNPGDDQPWIDALTKVLAADAAAVLECGLNLAGQSISLQTTLSELPSRQTIFAKNNAGSVDDKRRLAHEVADNVIYHLTGEPGICNSKIVFVKKKQDAKELAVIDYDGYGERLLTNSGVLNLSPRWSPDAGLLAFTSYKDGNPDLFLFDVASKKFTKLSRLKLLFSAPAWSPDGKRIAVTITQNGNADIYTLDRSGGNAQKLTNDPAIDSSPTWSPDGRQIAFTSDRAGKPQIYVMNADGADVHRVTFEGSYNDSPAWSPRGDRIAYVSRTDTGFQIFTMNANGEEILQISDGASNNENPSWSPSGSHLVFASNRGGSWQLYICQWNGANLRRLTTAGQNYTPSWSPIAAR